MKCLYKVPTKDKELIKQANKMNMSPIDICMINGETCNKQNCPKKEMWKEPK